MQDADIVRHINDLAAEEHALERAHSGQRPSDADRARLDEIGVALDQCWDLLRQRRARREFGQSPDDAEARPTDVVEGYKQ